ncbi:DEAD/DEAH box helicase [Mesobacillus harenae]|uniref:DEAD/DEAH box helicase n=1 Tax=Mesobacillus harenae TaxID=2213203 RepID=UPI0015806E0A|nr:DEAD/DEAH box helicase [Mesobacillus harenae]
MSKLETVYPLAVEQTKIKVFEDIKRYLETKDKKPELEDYLTDRSQYYEQIWINVWINKATGSVPKHEKKSYLSERGFEVDDVNRKLINQLFRTEIRDYQPFDVKGWIDETYTGEEKKWEDLYKEARAEFFQQQEEEKEAEAKRNIQQEISSTAEKLIDEQYELFYLQTRHYVAVSLLKDFTSRTKFKRVDTFALEEKLVDEGTFDPNSYSTVSQFFEELTGEIHKTTYGGRHYYEYETFEFVYERLITSYIFDLIPRLVLEQLSASILTKLLETNSKKISASAIKKQLKYSLDDVAGDFIEEIQSEYITDLLKIATIPFDAEVHKVIFLKDVIEREEKKAKEQADIQRKKQEEKRMLEDIFGQEYSPPTGRNMRYVLHIGETNTGKTFHALEKMKAAESGIYLAPLRLLALEVFDKLNADGTPCSLKTGEEEKAVANASHISCTVEMFHEKDFYDVAVIDEAQMITDKDRGFSWYKAITKANANEVHIIGSRNAKKMMLELLGDSEIEINEYSRDIPLEVESKEFKIKDAKKGDALICFSRRRVLETASNLERAGRSVSMIYGAMPPETRKKQMQRFLDGETSVIVSTDAIGMGLNLPIRRIVFLENEKFDGTRRRTLTSQEIKQIAGRAGRKGIYNVGKVAFIGDIKLMKRRLLQEDEPVHTFAIAPTTGVFERFQRYYRDLGTFFDLWYKFESPKGTKKASLMEERELYEKIRGTEIEARLPLTDLYGFLHLPFSSREPSLVRQWEDTMFAIINGQELPDPLMKNANLEELELAYKAVGLHLLFLYRLEKRTEAVYWERIREGISDEVHERLKTDVKHMTKKCRNCGKKLSWDHPFQICDNCHHARNRRYYD